MIRMSGRINEFSNLPWIMKKSILHNNKIYQSTHTNHARVWYYIMSHRPTAVLPSSVLTGCSLPLSLSLSLSPFHTQTQQQTQPSTPIQTRMFLDWFNYPAVAKGGDIFILWYYFGGVGLGLIVLAVTSLIVPDPPLPKALFTSKDKASIRPQQQLRQEEEQEEAKKPSNNDNDNNDKKEKENKTDPFDLPPNQIEKIRKTFRLTHAQMEEVLDESRRQHNNNNNNNDEGIGGMGSSLLSSSSLSSWTPHQKMNGLAYLLMLSVLVYVLNRDYGNVVTIWFVQTFPKEARTLGLLHPLP